MTSEGDAREVLLHYLLGEMTAEETAAFDLRLIEDGEFADRVAEARFDLLDAYAAGELVQPLRHRVELALLSSAETSVSLALARRLQDARPLGIGLPLTSRSRPRLAGWKRWRLPTAVAAAALLALVGGSYLVRTQRERPSRQIEARRQGESLAPRIGEPAFVLLLSPEVTRGAGSRRVALVPSGTRLLEIQLVLGSHSLAEFYRVELKSAAGEVLASFSRLGPQTAGSARFLQMTIPARIVRSGEYRFEVSAADTPSHPARAYPVTIVRRESSTK